jgi:hypothetical protein
LATLGEKIAVNSTFGFRTLFILSASLWAERSYKLFDSALSPESSAAYLYTRWKSSRGDACVPTTFADRNQSKYLFEV